LAALVFLPLVLGPIPGAPASAAEEVTARNPPWQLFFSPEGGCTQAIVDRIAGARASVLVQAYSFTSRPIAKALVDAHQRGVRVEVILDESQVLQDNLRANYFAKAGLPVTIDGAHVIAHNKVMVIDETTVITGSFNFTRAAEVDNAENLLFLTDNALVARYTQNWREHRAHSEPYVITKNISKSRKSGKKQ
jgi:phosphatidylserine/phosphatidylglycerophosphate/cardiolipin synthase-like enzyme